MAMDGQVLRAPGGTGAAGVSTGMCEREPANPDRRLNKINELQIRLPFP